MLSVEVCKDVFMPRDISVTCGMRETQISIGNMAYLSLARGLSRSHVQTKELNEHGVGCFTLVEMLFLAQEVSTHKHCHTERTLCCLSS